MLEDKPDKGRAWLIAFAACIINMILSGISRMIGILFVAVIDVYGVSRQEATMPFSVRNSIRSMAGPIVGLAGLHFKVRNITFCGGLIAALGACLCSIAPNVMWLTIFWGVIHGLGFAFANTLFQVVVNQYFEKHRATASGIALSGACVGSLVFPFIFEVILEQYGLNGAFLLLGGLVMNVLPPSILLMPPSWLDNTSNSQVGSQNAENLKQKEDSNKKELEDADIIEEIRASRVLYSQSFSNCPTEGIEIANVKRSASFKINRNALSSTQSFRSCSNKNSTQLNTTSEENKKKCGNAASMYDSELLSENFSSSELTWPNEFSCEKNSSQENSNEVIATDAELKKVQSSAIRGSMMSIVRLYQNPVFILISICLVAYIIIFIPMLAVIVDYGIDKGLPESDGKYLISSMALGDLIGRLGFGWVTDRGLMSISNFMMTSLLLQGIIVIMFPMANSFYTLTGLLILYGVTAGSVLVLFPILTLKHVNLEDQPIGMGCSGFLSGLVTFGLPPFIGYFRDGIGSYDGMFYITAAVSIISGILWLLEPVVVKYRKKQLLQNNLNS